MRIFCIGCKMWQALCQTFIPEKLINKQCKQRKTQHQLKLAQKSAFEQLLGVSTPCFRITWKLIQFWNISVLKCTSLLYLTWLGCPQNWVNRGNSCYYVIDTPTLKWSDARTTCQTRGGDLAIIRSEDENNFILELLKNQKTVKREGAWLGLYRKPWAGRPFYWIDDTPLTADHYSAWAVSEPSNPNEECVQMYAGSLYPGKWNDNQCSLSDASQAPVVLCQKGLMWWRGHHSFLI